MSIRLRRGGPCGQVLRRCSKSLLDGAESGSTKAVSAALGDLYDAIVLRTVSGLDHLSSACSC